MIDLIQARHKTTLNEPWRLKF